MYTHLINFRIYALQVCNNNLTLIYIVKNTCLEVIQKYNNKEYYLVTLKNHAITAKYVNL